MGHDLGGDDGQVVEVVEVEDLEIDALCAGVGVAAQGVEDLVGGAGRTVDPQLGGFATSMTSRETEADGTLRTVANCLAIRL